MNEYNIQIRKLFQSLDLGELTEDIVPMPLGYSHKMFAVTTTKGKYAVKALNPYRMCDMEARKRMETSERVSCFASRFVDAICALQFHGEVLLELEGQYYMIYEFVTGDTVDSNTISLEHCKRMGETLAKLHSIDFSELGIKEESDEERTEIDWNYYIEEGKRQNAPWSELLEDTKEKLSKWYRQGIEADVLLSKNRKMSHRNMDPRNVIWVNGSPRIIDWEEADYINPYYDFLHTAIHWSKCGDGSVNSERFLCFTKGYESIKPLGSVCWERVIVRQYLEPIEWLEYCLKQSLGMFGDDEKTKQTGSNGVFYMINVDIVPYKQEAKKLIGLIKKLT